MRRAAAVAQDIIPPGRSNLGRTLRGLRGSELPVDGGSTREPSKCRSSPGSVADMIEVPVKPSNPFYHQSLTIQAIPVKSSYPPLP